MKAFFLQTLQSALNRYLALDPESSKRLHKLNGKKIRVELKTEPAIIFGLEFIADRIEIITDIESVDLIISGTPLALLRLSAANDKRKHFFGDDVSLTGNLELGQHVTDLFDELDIDWEEILSRFVGDISAHEIGRFARGIKNFGKRLRDAMVQNINEFVHEEIDLFPPVEALEDFFADVDTLRMDVDRMEARIQQLQRGLL